MSTPATAIAPPTTANASGTRRTARRTSPTVASDLVAFGDILAVAAGALLPAFIYNYFGDVPANWAMTIQAGLIAGFIAQLWFRNAGMYDTEKLHDLPQKPLHLLTGTSVAIAAVIGFAMPILALHWHVTVWFVSWLSASFTLILMTRGISHAVLARMAAAGRFDRSVAVFGAGSISRRVHDHLKGSASGINFLGVYDDRAGDDRINPEGLEVTGKLENLLAEAYAGNIDDIIIALPQSAESRTISIVRKLEQAPSNVHVVTHLASDLIPARESLRVSQIGEVGLIDVKDKPLSGWSPLVKRAEDILVAGIGIIISLPILALAAIAIKLESNGPVIYRQSRRGLNRQVIEVLKLRTLTVSETDQNIRQVTVGDERVTRVGRFLRRTSIDELPQLWNVLKGEMSIVGPRPHALVHDEQFSGMLEDYANRHQVKPGITGLAQIKGLRGETRTPESIKARLEQDMAYVRSWSLWLDIKIIARTLIVVLTGKNAH